MPRVLVIDDDAAVRESMARMLRSGGYTVLAAASGEEGIDLARGDAFDAILSDMRMPDLSGMDVLRRLRDARVDACFIIMTGFGTVDTAVEAMQLGAVDFVQKPFYRDELLVRVRAATERRQLARQVNLLQRQIPLSASLEGLVGRSAPMVKVKEVIRRAAASPGSVLVTGETGTGKELAARAIHTGSQRAGKPFVPLNCAALTESLLESQLFGHARGAFTGATDARPGLVEHASGGTLFLDEIGSMSMALQATLLRVVESGEVRRIGENETRRIDVRIVSATNVDLESAVHEGSFRSDLYYRLNLHRVHMPALRDRHGDIPLLVQHFLDRYGRATGITGISAAAMGPLEAYAYPGNVRQLEHIIQRALAVAQPPELVTADLPDDLLAAGRIPPTPSEGTVTAARERAERTMIVATLARSHGEILAAARALQVSRTTMWRLMKKHDIQV